ncbi:MAG: GIY-YIG nuclease family protein [Lewinellaceae bacterium]|nr:GIY-YIG nuclease family protein [Lewinellaceae bacterium]
MYSVYILYSLTLDRYYIGNCEHLERRIQDHNTGHSGYTRRGIPWELKWSKTFVSRREAMAEENRIKRKKSRKYVEYLISTAG